VSRHDMWTRRKDLLPVWRLKAVGRRVHKVESSMFGVGN
jgi:hypothetical protein